MAAMTVGAIALMVLETAPIRPEIHDLAAVTSPQTVQASAVTNADVPIQPIKWRNIIVHSSAQQREIARSCHFIVNPNGQELVQATALWKRQLTGKHIFVPGNFNANSIAICVIGDFSQQAPSSRQFNSLVRLVQQLQRKCNISADHVYLRRDLDSLSDAPGAAFPGNIFTAHLLRPNG